MRHYANRRECVCVCTVQTHTQQADRDTKYVNMGLWEGREGGRVVILQVLDAVHCGSSINATRNA